MTRTRLQLLLVLAATLLLAGCGGDPEFSSLVASIDHGGHFHRQHVPLLGMARFFVGIAHPAGVKNVRIALFTPQQDDALHPDELAPPPQFGHGTPGYAWQPIVRTRSRREHQWTVIYAREHAHELELLICSVEPGEGVVVQVKLSPDRLVEFIDEHRQPAAKDVI